MSTTVNTNPPPTLPVAPPSGGNDDAQNALLATLVAALTAVAALLVGLLDQSQGEKGATPPNDPAIAPTDSTGGAATGGAVQPTGDDSGAQGSGSGSSRQQMFA